MNRLILGLFSIIIVTTICGADWPQFRGPNASGVSNEKNLPVSWSAKQNIRWKVKLPGRGLSNPVIANGRVYVTASSGWQQNRLHVLCFDEKTGKQLWERQFWATGGTQSHPKTCMAAPSPVTDGKNVFALFATHDMAALDKNGNLLWFRSLTGDYPTVGNNVGMASSPVLADNTLFLALENAGESFALAINAKTGINRWRKSRQRGINWVTPIAIKVDGKTQAVFQSPGELSAHDAKTGKKLWKLARDGMARQPSPIFADGKIMTQGAKFLVVRPSEGGAEPEVIWESRNLRCGYSSPLFYQGNVYALASRGSLTCADAANGKEIWNQRIEGDFAASIVAGDGKIYATNEEGTTTVIQTGRKPKILSQNRLNDKILATPAIANGAIYLRSDDYLYCIKHSD